MMIAILLVLFVAYTYCFDKISGLIGAVYTPFKKDYSLNLTLVDSIAKHLNNTKVVGAFVGGTTGEGLSLTLDERKQLAEAWVKAGKKYNVKVIIHVGADSLEEGRELAKHAQEIKADGISAMSPVFFRPATVDVLVDCMKMIAEGAPDLPFYYYHIPPMTGVNLDITQFYQKAVSKILNFNGIKFSDAIVNDITEIQWMIKDTNITPESSADTMSIYFGRDEQYDSAMIMGVDGGVGSTYSYAANITHKIISEYKLNNTKSSREWQYRSQKFIRIFAKYSGNNVNAHKYLCSLTTHLDFGPPRLPYVEISDENKKAMETELTDIGYFKWLEEAAK